MKLTYRTRSNPGDEMSETERQIRNAVQTRFQMTYATPEQFAKIDAEIAVLRAKMDKPVAAHKPSGKIKEKDILKAIMQLLNRHPKVSRAWRQNSMTARFIGKDGKPRFVRANTAVGMADIQFMLKTGRSGFIEVKTPTGIVAEHQQQFLDEINAGGGLAFVARSVEDVITRLNNL